MGCLATHSALNRFYASAFCMDGAFFLILAAIPFKVLDLGGGPVALGLVPAIGALTYIVFTLISGRVSDRVGRTRLCLAGNVLLILFALQAYRCDDLTQLLLLMPLMGLGKALYWPVVQATVGDISGPTRLERNIGHFNVAWSSGKAFGFLASGLLLSGFGFRTTFTAGAGLVVLAFLFLPRGKIEPATTTPLAGEDGTPAGDSTPAEARAQTVADLAVPELTRRTFRHMAWLANLAAYGAAAVLASHLPKWFAHLGWDEKRFGLFLALIFLTQTLSFLLLAGKVRFAYSASRLILPQVVAGLVLAVLPWFGGLGWYLAAAPLLGFAFGISYAGSIYYSLHTVSGKGMKAGIHESLIGVGGFLPPLLGGLAARVGDWLGAPYLLAAATIALALLAQILIWRPLRAGGDRAKLLGVLFALVIPTLIAPPVAAERYWPPWLRDDRPAPVYPEITVTVEWLVSQLGRPDLVVIDARYPDAYGKGHIPGAISLSPDNLPGVPPAAEILGGYGLASELQIVCYGDRASFVAMARLFWLLELAGGRKVRFLDGGLAAWRRSGHTLTGDIITLPPTHWGASADTTRLATIPYLRDHFGTLGHEILDARASGFESTSQAMDSPGSPWRDGHIPHALPVDFLSMIRDDGFPMAPEEIRGLIAQVGPRPNTYIDLGSEFTLYDDGLSGGGARGYLLLRLAGIPTVRYYPGGWREWSAQAGLPSVHIISAGELHERLRGEAGGLTTDTPPSHCVLFDVRHVIDFDKGHIPGAVHLPAYQFPDSLAVYLARYWPGLDRQTTPAVTYCYGRHCIRSRNCTTLLARAGFNRPEWFRGGMRHWEHEVGVIRRTSGE